MKKYLALFLTVTISLGMVGCAQTPVATDAPAPSTTGAQASTPDPTVADTAHAAYSTDGFETVDASGNRITTGRTATSNSAMASSSKYEVSQVGSEVMEAGGNAFDAAVAMGFALGVCEPFTSGIGGGGLATIHTAEGDNIFIDFREIAPAAATLDLYVDEAGASNGNNKMGGLASAIPGDVAGLLYILEHYGTMNREEVLEPAIRMATEGFEITTFCSNAISDAYEKAMQFPEMQAVYFDDFGLPYGEGTILTNPDLAKALQLIADEGVDGFYSGAIAEAMVATLSKYDGVMTVDDLAGYEVHVLEPVSSTYHDYQIVSAAPPSSGGTHLIEILNILENFDVASMDINSPEYIHLMVESFKLSFADRAQYMADTNVVPNVPLDGLTSKTYAAERAALIDMTQAQEFAYGDPTLHEHTDTTHFSVADAEGNVVGITKTINYYFGSGVMVDGFGFMMNNQMADFVTDATSVNCIEPGKKPLSSMAPTIILNEDNSPFMVLGTPGGSRIFAGVAQTISRVIDHGMDLHDAVCVPKVWNSGAEMNMEYEAALHGYEEYAITQDTLDALADLGHTKISMASSGSLQAIEFLDDGTLYGTADPRQDGKAVGY